MDRLLRINGHSHILPTPEQIPSFMKTKEVFWVDEGRKYMFQKDWKRPITDPSFFLEAKLEWMDRNRIDHCVVITLSQLYGNGIPQPLLSDVLRFQNDFNAGIQQSHPDKFTSGFVVQPAFMEAALLELERCVTQNNLRLLCLPTHFQQQDGSWRCIFEEDLDPLLSLANTHKLAIEVHPYDGEKIINLPDRSWRFHLVWMLAQCADAYHFYTLNGMQTRYPDIRMCFAHGGQLAQINLGRRIQGFDGRPDLFQGQEHPRRSVGHPGIFFDTLVHDTYSLKLLIERQGSRQVIMGLDDPYPLGEMENQRQSSYPGKLLDLAVEREIINQEEFKNIWGKNVIRWLYGEDQGLLNSFYSKISSK